MRKDNWICDCKPPVPDIMSFSDRKCVLCGMKHSDIKKRIKANNNNYAVKRYCPKCKFICGNKRHQSILYTASMLTYHDRDEKGNLVVKYTQAGLKRLAML